MMKFANFLLVVMTLVTASTLYSLEHKTRGQERIIAKGKAQMLDQSEAIKLLKAEWSSLTRPERLQRLAEQTLGMKRIEPDQFVTAAEMPARVEALVTVDAPKAKSGIEDLLKKMQ
jgi:cell division protein FtsL